MDLRRLLTRGPVAERDGVLDFVSDKDADYCRNFGDQWNRFRALQVDSLSGSDESHRRFFAETGWAAADLRDKVILDAGCGAGRFAEIALQQGAFVVAVDLSEAVFACRRTLERFPAERYLVIRADLFELPLRHGCFDGVYSLGVLQHTPAPLEAIARLSRHLTRGGYLAVWIYEKKRSHMRALLPRLWIRGLTARWSTQAKLRMSKTFTAIFFPVGWTLSWLGRPGEVLSYFLPYACRHHLARNDLKRQWDYCVMDTYDWYGPTYELAQTETDVIAACRSAGLGNVRRLPARGMAVAGQRT